MKTIIKSIILGVALCCSGVVAAQTSASGYFLEDFTYRFKLNPAMGNSRNFVAFPALGNFKFGVNGNLGIKDVLYNVNGRTTTFMNPGVSAQEVMSNINDRNKFNISVNTPILAFGFKGIGGFNTVSLNVHTSAGFVLPGDIFSFLKEGVRNDFYDIANVKAHGTAYVDVALNHSHQINPNLRVGATLKVIVGAANIYADMKQARLTLGTDSWDVTTEAEISTNMTGFRYETKVNENTGKTYVSGAKVKDPSVGGYGAAVDLGATYTPEVLPDLTVSAAILDLGFINWKNNMVASTDGVRHFSTGKYSFNVDGDAPNSFDNEFDLIKDDLSKLYELDDLGDSGSRAKMLAATMNIGVEYKLPVYRKLAFGLLNTTRFNGPFSWTEFRLSANWNACKVFGASVNASTGTYGTNIGALISLHAPGFNLFLGADHIPTKLSKQGAPLSSNGSFNMGINFLF